MHTVDIISFGYLHGDPPAAHLTLDLRHHFRDPHVSPELRYMTANDRAVRQAVHNTPGIPALIEATADAIVAFLHGPSAGPVRVAVGCAGGRHRAAAVAMALKPALADEDVTATVTHRDLDKPVVQR
ncbi:ATPase [Streptomyces platensis]|uniref:RapZ C-terminal domain-containing protein n=1 Tax=Streptomyces platensis TaxID=58346 RepID=UPI002E140985|nr:RNase adapter RapZ [Streptomyces platensis]WSI53635.1 ATPase [Streptomyces platensis]